VPGPRRRRAAQQAERDSEDSKARIAALKIAIKDSEEQIAKAKEAIEELKASSQRLSELRVNANLQYRHTLNDQTVTTRILNQALTVLQRYYAPEKKAPAFSQQEPVGPPPPAGFKEYKKNKGGNAALELIKEIIADTEKVTVELRAQEAADQRAYEEIIRDNNDSVDANARLVATETEAKAKNDLKKDQEKANLAGINERIESLAEEKADVKKSCDFTLKNFDIRQQSRDDEVEALRHAKQILSGADYGK